MLDLLFSGDTGTASGEFEARHADGSTRVLDIVVGQLTDQQRIEVRAASA